MRRTLAIFLCLLGLLIQPAVAQTASNESVPVLLNELAKAKLKDAQTVLEKLETTSDERLIPIFNTLLGGKLYYVKETYKVIGVEGKKDAATYVDVLSGEQLPPFTKKQIKKIRVNNKLRVYLRAAIARIQLTDPDESKREAAVLSLLAKLTTETAATLSSLRDDEKSAKVLEAMDVALATFTAVDSKSSDERMAAVATLEGSLYPQVRNTLVKVADNDADEAVKAAAAKALSSIEQKVEMYGFVDQLFFGLSLGSVLLLAAIGLAITFGVMGVINMAHGEMIMLGAYTTYVVQLLMPNMIGYSIWVAIPAAFVVSGLMGILIERTVISRLHGRPLETLLATFGISLVLQQAVRTIFSPLNRQVSTPEWMSGSLEINPVLSLTLNRLYILAFALLVFIALMIILKKTNLGLHVRAVSQNRDMAKAMGIRTERVDAMTFGLGSGIAGIAGVALSQLTNVGPNLGQAYIIDSFMVVVFGGVGNLLGTLVAAFSLGIANKFLEPITGAVLASILVLVFIILFIQKKPKGLFPQKGRAAE